MRRLRCTLAVVVILTSLPLVAQTSKTASKPGSRPTTRPAATSLTITVQNLAPFARQQLARAVVPFAKGEFTTEIPALRVKDKPTVWQPFGARWPDGSLRQALCFFPVRMAALKEHAYQLEVGEAKSDGMGEVPKPTEAIRLWVATETEQVEATPKLARIMESNAARRVELHRCRVGKTGLVFELLITATAGQQHFDVNLGVFFSDPQSTDVVRKIKLVQARTSKMHLSVRNGARVGVREVAKEEGSHVDLLRDTYLADGQGIRRAGVLRPRLPNEDTSVAAQTMRAAAVCPLLGATTWRRSRAYGPFGVIPELPRWLRGARLRLALGRRHGEFARRVGQPGDPFQDFGLGLAKNPARSGLQEDFGILKVTPVVATGLPSFLLEVELSAMQEACRPVHYFEPNGSMVKAKDHPDWVIWSGRTHWHCRVSKDRLGKPCPEPQHPRHDWDGKDRQHWSSNYLCGYYLLTGDAWALREIEQEVELFLAGQTVRKGLSTSSPDAPRGAGRALMAGCWLYQCTGSKALLRRMHARMQQVYIPTWTGREWGKDKIRLMEIRRGEKRHIERTFWAPWQEAIAATGFAALYRTSGDKQALQIAKALARSVTLFGWSVQQPARVGYAIAWNKDATPLQRNELADPSKARWADYGISAWSLGAVLLAQDFANAEGDAELQRRSTWILRSMRQQRKPPKDGWFDDFGDWDAVRL